MVNIGPLRLRIRPWEILTSRIQFSTPNGPNYTKNYNVIFLVQLMKKYWKKISWRVVNKNKKSFYESNLLKINCNKAKNHLKWKCILSFAETINMVTDWYKSYYLKPKKIYSTSFNQVKKYERLLKKRSII